MTFPAWTRDLPTVPGVYEARVPGGESQGRFQVSPTNVVRNGEPVFALGEEGKTTGPPTWWFHEYEWRGPLERDGGC